MAQLIELALLAHSPATRAPLLSARYHLFLRALEGAYVVYHPTKRVLLDRQTQVDGNAAFEVALCRECGQHYFVGRIVNGEWQEAVRDPTQDEFGAMYLRLLSNEPDVSDDDDDDADANSNLDIHYLCARCAKISRAEFTCGHTNVLRVVKEASHKDSDRADQLPRCGACGYHGAGRDPVREIIYGADGPHAVVATTLAQMLPPERRKVLAFADGRQEAAYFAWYLDDSYADVLQRNLLLKAIQRSGGASEGLALRDVAHSIRNEYRAAKILPASTSDLEWKRRVWRDLYREFLTDELRLALEGVGAIRWTIQLPEWIETPRVFLNAPWELNETQARDLLWLLLDTMRYDHAIELLAEEGVEVGWNDLGEHIAPREFVIGAPNKRKHVKSWDGKHGRRAKFLAKLLEQKGFMPDTAIQLARDALREMWSE